MPRMYPATMTLPSKDVLLHRHPDGSAPTLEEMFQALLSGQPIGAGGGTPRHHVLPPLGAGGGTTTAAMDRMSSAGRSALPQMRFTPQEPVLPGAHRGRTPRRAPTLEELLLLNAYGGLAPRAMDRLSGAGRR